MKDTPHSRWSTMNDISSCCGILRRCRSREVSNSRLETACTAFPEHERV